MKKKQLKNAVSSSYFFLSSLLLVVPTTLYAQTFSKKDSITIFSYIQKAESFHNLAEYDSAVFYANKAEKLAQEKKYEKGYAHALLKKEEIFIDYDELDQAEVINKKVTAIGKKLNNPLLIAHATLHAAQIKMYQNKLEEAIDLFQVCTQNYFNQHPSYYAALAYNDFGYTYGLKDDLINQTNCLIQSIKIYESLPELNYGELAVVYNNLSLVYYRLKDNDKTIEYAKKSIYYREKHGDINDLALGYCNISQLYRLINPKEAKKYQELCVTYAEESKNEDRIVQAYITSALIASDAENRELALEFEKKAVKILEEKNNNPASLALRYIAIGMHLVALKKNSEEAISYYNKALKISEAIHSKTNISEVYKNLTKVYTLQNNYKAAFESQKKYHLYRDSIVDEKTNISIAELETKFQTEKKEQEIKLLSTENKLAQKQKYIYIALASLLFLTGFSLFFVYRNQLKTARKIKELNVLKSKFFANISHEFRTPLTLIKSPVQNLQKVISNEDEKKQLQLIDRNANRMLELVDQLLALSKIDSGKLKLILKEGNSSSFLHSITEPFDFQAKENNINFEINIEKNTTNHYFDKDVVEKIVTNILSNAFKYTPTGQKIEFYSSIENKKLKLTISNAGVSIKKEEINQLFERFYQKNESEKGAGIGLALVKELVELYEGEILTQVSNQKLQFTILLPLEKFPANAIVVTKENTPSIENQTTENDLPIVLIADDNSEIRSVLKDILKENFQILEAGDGEKALKMAKKEIPDCIISDIMMPKMNGYEFTKAIKSNELTSFIPVVLLTAKTAEEAHLEGLQSTADAFLTKPFRHEIIKLTVTQLITERKKLQERYSQELVLKPVDIVINSIDEKFLEKLQEILHKEVPNSDFTSDNFASAVGMSRMQLHRKLKTLLGVSATEFLRTERLKTAVELLKKGNGNISEIAYSVGFNDMSYFSKCFKEMYHCTPSEYIEKNS
ncbi:response regulator [Flavobacterium sp. J27]|uniref:response regulator n=1 Tax=Flavobacterium sp. J27 TaxID=2060419 RepID=UPI00102FA898|nr:response regulator [Flavobacterium sp. J27]